MVVVAVVVGVGVVNPKGRLNVSIILWIFFVATGSSLVGFLLGAAVGRNHVYADLEAARDADRDSALRDQPGRAGAATEAADLVNFAEFTGRLR